MLLTDVMSQNIEKYGEYPFLYYGEKAFTNVETHEFAGDFAAVLKKHGIEKGDRVIVCMPNCPEVIFSYQGILRTGAIVIPVMFLLHQQEIHYILKDSEAKAVIASSMTFKKVQKACEGLSFKPKIFVVDDVNSEEAMNIYKEAEGLERIETSVSATEDDVAVILYTSGTTGKPKGVMLTHKNLYSNAATSASLNQDDERGTTLGVLPLAHVYGFTVSNACFLLGASIVIFSMFNLEEVCKAIEKHKVKGFNAVPAMIHAMVTSPITEKYDLSSLEYVGSGSAPIPVSLIEAFKKKFNADVLEGYGLSEAAPVVSTHRRSMPIKPGSVGLPLPGVEIKIVDDQGNELPTGEVGELIVRGDNITPGYFRNEEATKEAIKDGWLYTGDMAKVDEDGYLYIVDRKKDLIIRGGFNIYPRELEELISRHEAVSEVAVVGVPSERMGEEVVAFVVKKPKIEVSEEDILEYCQSKLAKYKTPRRVLFVKTLPKNAVGKVLKQNLRSQIEDVELFI